MTDEKKESTYPPVNEIHITATTLNNAYTLSMKSNDLKTEALRDKAVDTWKVLFSPTYILEVTKGDIPTKMREIH